MKTMLYRVEIAIYRWLRRRREERHRADTFICPPARAALRLPLVPVDIFGYVTVGDDYETLSFADDPDKSRRAAKWRITRRRGLAYLEQRPDEEWPAGRAVKIEYLY